ncbi:unnamed protein product [Arabidopsis thaliana]|uniref:MADS-box family protein n=1 Tax=Arabidopsis thaliana TaxID=3702 RepID=A0A654G5F3_ARATH|nr:unnamed protein product [Arabidopsis thaliana]
MDQEAFLSEKIEKAQAQLQKLRDENRVMKARQIMWGCIEGNIDVCQLGEKDLKDLSSVIDDYLDSLKSRVEYLKKNEDADVPSMDGSHHQSETNRFATTADACVPNITNNP